jgi:Na+-driven multidrug efflux pump
MDDSTRFWIAIILSILYWIGLVFYIIYALKTGNVWLVGKFGGASKFSRASEPAGYWITIFLYVLLIPLIFYLLSLNPVVHAFLQNHGLLNGWLFNVKP